MYGTRRFLLWVFLSLFCFSASVCALAPRAALAQDARPLALIQHPDDVSETVASLLQSNKPSDTAWAAYLAWNHEQKDYAPALLQALKSTADDASREAWALRMAILDALIQMDADAPAEAIVPLGVKGCADPVIVLLGRSPADSREPLLALMSEYEGGGVRWKAVCGLLAEAKAPDSRRLCSLALRPLRQSLSVLREPAAEWAGAAAPAVVAGLRR
jgi:hypothetical protein